MLPWVDVDVGLWGTSEEGNGPVQGSLLSTRGVAGTRSVLSRRAGAKTSRTWVSGFPGTGENKIENPEDFQNYVFMCKYSISLSRFCSTITTVSAIAPTATPGTLQCFGVDKRWGDGKSTDLAGNHTREAQR